MTGDDEVEISIDLVIMILCSTVFALFMLPIMFHMVTGNFGGFDTQIEKTALPTGGEMLPPVDPTLSNGDVVLIVAVADRYTPMPGKLNIRGTEIPLKNYKVDNTTHSFEAERVALIQSAYNACDWNNPTGKWDLVSGPDGKMYWRFS